jgi:DNA repair photolyase
MLALRDFDLMEKYDVEFGVTLVFDNEGDRQIWEPGADITGQRLAVLRDAYALGIRTWVSMEPVFYPSQTLELIRSTQSFVMNYKVGKLNHMPDIERRVDWKRFVEDVVLVLMTTGRHYYIKNDLWAYTLERFRRAYHQAE